MTLLGIDYGSKRVGMALSDDNERLAFPLGMIHAAGLKPEAVATQIFKAASDRGIRKVVLGESTNLKGERNSIMTDIDACAAELRRLGLEVESEPEWFSTAQAERFQGKKDDIDASAAAVILQAHLDRMNGKRKAADGGTASAVGMKENAGLVDEEGNEWIPRTPLS